MGWEFNPFTNKLDKVGGSKSALNDLTDVTITSPADNELLAYDNASGEWINQTPTEAGLDGLYLKLDQTTPQTVTGGTPTFDTSLIVESSAAGTRPLLVKGAAGQTASLTAWQDSAGVTKAYIEADGGIVSSEFSLLGGTAGGLLFIDVGSDFSQEPTELFWDDAIPRKLGVGTGAPAAKLEINVATVNIPGLIIQTTDDDSTYNLVEFQNAAGTPFISFDPSAKTILWQNTGNSLFIGNNAGLNDDLTNNWNTFIGNEAGEDVTTGDNNMFLGYKAGNQITTGSGNVAAGGYALQGTSTGMGNALALGYNSLGSASGGRLTGVGYNTLNSCSGDDNVAVGYGAGTRTGASSDCVFIGSYNRGIAGHRNTTAGYASGWNATGNNNTFYGFEAGYSNTGGGAVIIGAYLGLSTNFGANALAIDNNNDATPLILGDFSNHWLKFHGRTATPSAGITLGVGVTTFAVTRDVHTITGDGGGNTVATITGGLDGQVLTLIFVDANVTITDDNTHAADSVDLSAAFTSADDTTLQLVYDGTSWYEVSRSVN